MIQLKDITQEEYTKYVGLLTESQKNSLIGQLYTDDSYFNPITDYDYNWIISVEEINYCTNEEFLWVKDLPLIEYKPKNSNFIL